MTKELALKDKTFQMDLQILNISIYLMKINP